MNLNSKQRESFIKKNTAIILILAVYLSCSPSFAETDFSYLQITPASTIKLINPLYLDKTKTVKPIIKTSIPYKGTFNESDYFSSEIDDSKPQNEINTTTDELEIIETSNTSQKDENNIHNIPNNSFFAPPNINTTEQEIKNAPINIFEGNVEEELTTNNLPNIEENELEGKIINKIDFVGLKTIQEDTIKNILKTQVGTLFRESELQEDLQRIYAIGFFTDEMSIEPEINTDGSVNLKFVLQENIPVTGVSIIGNTVISSMELMPFISHLKDLPQNISNINQAIDKINTYYHNKGYILATVDSVDDNEDGNLTFSIKEGIISKIMIEGNEKTKDYVIERNIMTQPNTIYNENYLKEDLSRIYSTKIFKEVNREIIPNNEEEGKYNVKVIVKEESPNALSLGGGIDNGLGAFGSVSYCENNFLGRGQKLSLSGILGSGIILSDASMKDRMNYQVELNFFEPYFINADNSLQSKLYFRDFGSWQVPLAIEQRIGINTTVEHKVRGYKHLTTSFSAGFENINVKEGDFNKISQLYSQRNLDIRNRSKELADGFFINLAPGVKYSTLDSEEIPRNGVIASAKFIEAISLSDFKHTNGRLAGGITKYFPVREKSSLSLTAKGGLKVHGDDMPDVMAFRLGGPYSMRGFRMSGVGTGDAFIMGSAELATPLPFVDRLKWEFLHKIRLTFFVDAGQIFDETTSSLLFDRPLSAITAGVGLKMYVPGVGPISVDYGIPITNPGHYGSRNGYFTFGSNGINTQNW